MLQMSLLLRGAGWQIQERQPESGEGPAHFQLSLAFLQEAYVLTQYQAVQGTYFHHFRIQAHLAEGSI